MVQNWAVILRLTKAGTYPYSSSHPTPSTSPSKSDITIPETLNIHSKNMHSLSKFTSKTMHSSFPHLSFSDSILIPKRHLACSLRTRQLIYKFHFGTLQEHTIKWSASIHQRDLAWSDERGLGEYNSSASHNRSKFRKAYFQRVLDISSATFDIERLSLRKLISCNDEVFALLLTGNRNGWIHNFGCKSSSNCASNNNTYLINFIST